MKLLRPDSHILLQQKHTKTLTRHTLSILLTKKMYFIHSGIYNLIQDFSIYGKHTQIKVIEVENNNTTTKVIYILLWHANVVAWLLHIAHLTSQFGTIKIVPGI